MEISFSYAVGEPLTFGPVAPVPVAARHEEFAEHPELGFPYLGYVLAADGVGGYLAGDTVVYEGPVETLARFRIDRAFLPINGRDFFRTRQRSLAVRRRRDGLGVWRPARQRCSSPAGS